MNAALDVVIWLLLVGGGIGIGVGISPVRPRPTVCTETRAGDSLVWCACGSLRPATRPHGWKKPGGRA